MKMGTSLPPGSASAVCCVIPTIVNEETHDIRLGMTYNEVYATMKQRPCFFVMENDSGLTPGLFVYQALSARDLGQQGLGIAFYGAGGEPLVFYATEATDYPVYASNTPH